MSASLSLFELDLPPDEIGLLERLLSQPERDRARRYRFTRDATRFIARRGQLRMLLGHQLGCAPDRVAFVEGASGRPIVPGGPAFSTASSGAVGLCAIAADGPIGCDIEQHDPRLADRALAERLFAPAEYRALAALPDDRWAKGFFDCWACKEAVVKALGVGLSMPLASFEVPVAPIADDPPATPIRGLRLQTFDLLPDFSIAAACAADAGMSAPRWFDRQASDRLDRSRTLQSIARRRSARALPVLSVLRGERR